MAIKLNVAEVNLLLPKKSRTMRANRLPQSIDEISCELANGLTLEVEFKGCNTEIHIVNNQGVFYHGSATLSFKDIRKFNRQKAALKAFNNLLISEKMKGNSRLLNDEDKTEIVEFIFMNIPNVSYDLIKYAN